MNRWLTLVDELLGGGLDLEVLQGNAIVLMRLWLLLLVDGRGDQGLLTFARGLSCGHYSKNFFVFRICAVGRLRSFILAGGLLLLPFEVRQGLVRLLYFDSGWLEFLIRLVVVDVGVLEIRL